MSVWVIASRAARRRGIALGTPPCTLALLAGGASILAAGESGSQAVETIVLGIAAIVDARTGYIFDPVIVAGLFGVLAASTVEHRLTEAAFGALAAMSAMFLIRALSGNRGVGLGDVKLAAVVGSGLGPLHGVAALGWGFVVGGGAAVALLAAGRLRWSARVPFGPYLLAGSLSDLAYHRLTTGVFP